MKKVSDMDVLKKLRLPPEKIIIELDLTLERTKEALKLFENIKKKQEEEYRRKNG